MLDLIKDADQVPTDVQGPVRWGGTLLVCVILPTETGRLQFYHFREIHSW